MEIKIFNNDIEVEYTPPQMNINEDLNELSNALQSIISNVDKIAFLKEHMRNGDN